MHPNTRYTQEGDNVFNGKQNVLGKSYFESLAIGDRLDRENVNPALGNHAHAGLETTLKPEL
jgi:hypothetical protein